MECRYGVLLLVLVSLVPAPGYAQGKAGSESPMMSTHHKGVAERGDHVMGFSHEKTTHHFRMFADGGAIEVQASDPKDVTSREQIRKHLAHIVTMFAAGDFSGPMMVHGRVPPGVPAMKRLKGEITYKFSELEQGGVVRITTRNSEAIKAVHEFLTFQIEDHQTGDSTKVSDDHR
jgi:hypothetical protein